MTGLFAATGEEACTGEAHEAHDKEGDRAGFGNREAAGEPTLMLLISVSAKGPPFVENSRRNWPEASMVY